MLDLVTGGAGFIGSHLVDQLLAQGHHVIVLDNFATGRTENLSQAIEHPQLTIHDVDICDADSLSPYFDGVGRVFHLAALADIVPSIQQPENYLKVGVQGTVSVLQASVQAGVTRFLYAASSSCYGTPDVYPTPESAAIRPQYPYALAKTLGEQCVMHWAKVYGLPAVSLRLFNVYGPRSRTSGAYGAVFGVFLAQKLAGKPFTVVGDGSQTRDFTYVSDVVAAFTDAANSDLAGEILNVGSSQTYSINQLVKLLGGDVTYVRKRPGEPDCTFADISRITQLLGWKPQFGFEDGVNIMLDNIAFWNAAPIWDRETINAATKDWFKYLGPKG